MESMKLDVEVHEEEKGGYWAEVKNLPGCFTNGDTLDELYENLQDAVKCHLEGLANLNKNKDTAPKIVDMSLHIANKNTDKALT